MIRLWTGFCGYYIIFLVSCVNNQTFYLYCWLFKKHKSNFVSLKTIRHSKDIHRNDYQLNASFVYTQRCQLRYRSPFIELVPQYNETVLYMCSERVWKMGRTSDSFCADERKQRCRQLIPAKSTTMIYNNVFIHNNDLQQCFHKQEDITWFVEVCVKLFMIDV